MTAGIVVDNYKLDSFKKQLTGGGFPEFEVVPFTTGTSTIKVSLEKSQLPTLELLVKKMELNFKRRN